MIKNEYSKNQKTVWPVCQYEASTGIEAQNLRQLEKIIPNNVEAALNSDIQWHLDHTQEAIIPLETALSIIVE